MTSRRPGAPRAARRPVAASGRGASHRQRTRGPAPAARQRSSAAPARPGDGVGFTITRRAMVLGALLVIALATLVPTLNTYVAQRQQLARLESRVQQQEQQVTDLQHQVDRWEDPAFVAAQARERLLFAMPGETQYRLTDTSGKRVPLTSKQQDVVEAARGPWYAVLWKSVEGSSRLTPSDLPAPGDDTPSNRPQDTTR